MTVYQVKHSSIAQQVWLEQQEQEVFLTQAVFLRDFTSYEEGLTGGCYSYQMNYLLECCTLFLS